MILEWAWSYRLTLAWCTVAWARVAIGPPSALTSMPGYLIVVFAGLVAALLLDRRRAVED